MLSPCQPVLGSDPLGLSVRINILDDYLHYINVAMDQF
jgi:hypothetical protein